METQYDTPVTRQKVAEDFRTLVHDAEELLKASAHDVTEKAGEARSRLTDALERAKHACLHLEQSAVAAGKTAAHDAEEAIRQRPYQSIGMACAVGFLLGVLLTRR